MGSSHRRRPQIVSRSGIQATRFEGGISQTRGVLQRALFHSSRPFVAVGAKGRQAADGSLFFPRSVGLFQGRQCEVLPRCEFPSFLTMFPPMTMWGACAVPPFCVFPEPSPSAFGVVEVRTVRFSVLFFVGFPRMSTSHDGPLVGAPILSLNL